jgi:hypothetical protein
MVPIHSLWLPILLSAVAVFVASSVIHMLLPYHRSDFKKVPAEDEAMAALRDLKIPPGDYVMPFAGDPEAMKSEDYIAKTKEGPVLFMTVMDDFAMGKSLVLWFLYSIVIAVFAAYITGRALGPGAYYLEVFRFVGAAAFGGYTLGLWQNTIWYKRSLATTVKSTFDGLVYASLTAGMFGWLWPAG